MTDTQRTRTTKRNCPTPNSPLPPFKMHSSRGDSCLRTGQAANTCTGAPAYHPSPTGQKCLSGLCLQHREQTQTATRHTLSINIYINKTSNNNINIITVSSTPGKEMAMMFNQWLKRGLRWELELYTCLVCSVTQARWDVGSDVDGCALGNIVGCKTHAESM